MEKKFYIAGVKFRPREVIAQAIKELKVGDYLDLECEPENKFDPNAIKIGYNYETPDGVEFAFLGYVPKKFTADVSADLEIGVDLKCIVEEINASAPTYEMFKVVIRDAQEDSNV